MSVRISEAPDLRVDVHQLGQVDVVTITGELDLASVRSLRAVLCDASVCSGRGLVVDLDEVTFMDTTGLRTLIAARRLCSVRGGHTVLLTREGSQPNRLLALLGMERTVDIVHDLGTALRIVATERSAAAVCA